MERKFDRYAVIKWDDAQKCLTPEELKQLVALGVKFQQYRRDTQRRWECVVIEHDWPEYELVWKAIEKRVDNPKPLPAMTKEVRSLVEAISEAVLADEIAEGCDISSGMFGATFSQLVHELAEAERKARAFDMIAELMGYVQNGTDGIITLFQDDATMSYWISHRTAGRTNPDWQEYGTSLQAAIKLAYEKHGGE